MCITVLSNISKLFFCGPFRFIKFGQLIPFCARVTVTKLKYLWLLAVFDINLSFLHILFFFALCCFASFVIIHYS